jgi:hypothetical protein
MTAGRRTLEPNSLNDQELYFLARRLGLRLHMRTRQGFFMRGLDVWFDQRMSLPRQAAMLSVCIERAQAKRAGLKNAYMRPLRKVTSLKKHNAA